MTMWAETDRKVSYVVCTKNKLPYLKCVIPDLVAACSADEEIVVFDGASTDGSSEYLADFYEQGKFRVFRSEKDINQAHGLNKAIMTTRGEVVKIILDDDVFHYPTIKKCVELMHQHPELDAMGTNFARARYSKECHIRIEQGIQEKFEHWRHHQGEPFWFVDQVFMFRRSSLPVVGLWHTGCYCIDVEMTLRLTAQRQARLGWFTGISAIHLLNENSLGANPVYNAKSTRDVRRLHEFYGLSIPVEFQIRQPTLKQTLRKKLAPITQAIRIRTRLKQLMSAVGIKIAEPLHLPKENNSLDYAVAYQQCKIWLENNHRLESSRLLS